MRAVVARFMSHRVTDLVVVVMILSSVALLVIETFLPEDSPTFLACESAGHLLTAAFVIELALRFVAMPSRKKFLRYYWLDVVAVLPVARPLRILRVLRLLRLYRVGVLINRRLLAFGEAFRRGRSELIAMVVIMLIVLLAAAIGMNLAEGHGSGTFGTVGSATWWSLFTLVSVSPLSDVPVSFVGRILALLVVVSGVGFSATVTGIVSAAVIHRLSLGMEVSHVMLEDLREHVVVCGWNRIGLRMLAEFGLHPVFRDKPVVIIAEAEQAPEIGSSVFATERLFFLSGDATRIELLKRAGIERASVAILLADKSIPRSDQDRDARSVLTALTIEKLNPKIHTCVELLNRDNEAQLGMAGVEEIIVPDEHAASLLALAAHSGRIGDLFHETVAGHHGNAIHRVLLPSDWADREVRWAHQLLKEQHNALLLALERTSEGQRTLVPNPPPGEQLITGDVLVLVAEKSPPGMLKSA